ncbi:MAG: branched-chain amino acid aminotransferase [Coriobacteriia bacterium]|nr:branched-chain amino acid aminotransferase [Coriobacteriia bacterium]
MNISMQTTTAPKPKPQDESKLGFGQVFTDHMFLMNYDEGEGWHDPRIVPYGKIELDPAAMCLHYGQEVFEGLKAYRSAQGKVLFFRPEQNMQRLNKSCERLCIPMLDEDFALEAMKALVNLDQDWIPRAEGTSLYIRPFVFAIDPAVGVHPGKHLIFAIILSPVGAYYPEGINPVRILVETTYVRAVRGGMGNVKSAGNYASSLKAQGEASKLGYSQVMWLDAIERKYIEEVGAMNVFFVVDGEVITPALEGSILPGITRLSSIELLRSWGLTVTERRISIDEVAAAAAAGTLEEAFGTGTAVVVTPIGELKVGQEDVVINNGRIGAVTQRLYDELTGIQWGRTPDTFGWVTPL